MTRGQARLRRALLVAAVAALAVGLGRVAAFRPLGVSGEAPDDGYARVPAVFHVHTTLSDGGGSPEEAIGAARAAGVAVLGITDHNNVDAMPYEGYRDGVLVLVGSELSTPAGHLLGPGLARDPAFRFAGDARDALEDVLHLGGVPFAAHPFSPRDDLRWRGFELPGPWGIELLNGDSEARRAGPRLLLTAALYRLNPDYALLAASAGIGPALERWDALLAERDTPGIAGADAHSRLALAGGLALRFPSYEALFRQARTYLLLRQPLRGDAASDRQAVLEALRAGRCYVGVDALAPSDGFSFTVVDAGGRRFTMGDQVDAGGALRAVVRGRMPGGTRIVLRRDGAAMGEGVSSLEMALPGPGVYRVEAWVPGWPVPWVISNPVYVFDAAAREARRLRAALPGEPSPLGSAPLSFATPAFHPEHDAASSTEASGVARRAGPEGSPAFRLVFDLARPPAPGAFTWCALVNREPRDLAGWTGLRLKIRGDGEYRLWVQLRDPNPASADEGLEWWMASLRTSLAWRDVQLPFARFRTLNPRSDGRLDLDRIRALVFVLDPATVKPGTKGIIWLTDIQTYR